MDMSTAILSLSESGELQAIHDRWLNTRTCSQKNSDNTDQLHLKSFRGLFLICGITCLAAVFIYFCLICSKFRRHSPKLSEQAGSPSVRIRRFLSFVDEKEDSLKSRMKRKHVEMLSRSSREEQQSRNEVREGELDEGHNGNGYFR